MFLAHFPAGLNVYEEKICLFSYFSITIVTKHRIYNVIKYSLHSVLQNTVINHTSASNMLKTDKNIKRPLISVRTLLLGLCRTFKIIIHIIKNEMCKAAYKNYFTLLN